MLVARKGPFDVISTKRNERHSAPSLAPLCWKATESGERRSTPSLAPLCWQVTQTFRQALFLREKRDFFADYESWASLDPYLYKTLDVQGTNGARLSIDFFNNRLITQFRGQTHEVQLSVALGIMRDIGEIMQLLRARQTQLEHVRTLENGLAHALEICDSAPAAYTLTIDGEKRVAIYPDAGRIWMKTSTGQSSTPLPMLQSCAHLFNKAYAAAILPTLEMPTDNLQVAIKTLYVGRCILGLGWSMYREERERQGYNREFSRIAALFSQKYVFFTEPLR